MENLDPPQKDLLPPSLSTLKTHQATFEAARKNPNVDLETFQRSRDNYVESLKLHDKKHQAAAIKSIKGPDKGTSSYTPATSVDPDKKSTASLEVSASASASASATPPGLTPQTENDPDQTPLMEVVPSTLGSRDGHSWGDQVEDEEGKWKVQGPPRYSYKCRWEASLSRGFFSCSAAPFHMNDKAREEACDKLYREAQTSQETKSPWIFKIL